MDILRYVLIFWAGIIVGILIKAWLNYRFSSYTGLILVKEEEGRTVYSLVLDDYPEKLELKKHVIFKVASEEESNRE